MVTSPKVSIITPSFNQGEFIEETILSVINQEYDNIEYIVIDGNSTDKTKSILEKYSKHFSYYISENDNGQSHAINKGLNIATGKYINWLNSDDILYKDSVKLLVNYLETNPEIDIVFGNTLFIDRFSNPLYQKKDIAFDYKIVTYAINYLPQPSALIRTKAFKEIGLLKENYHFCMDHELWLRFSQNGYKIAHFNHIISGYRLHGFSKGVSYPPQIKFEQRIIKTTYGINYGPGLKADIIYGLFNLLFRLKRIILIFLKYGSPTILPGRLKLYLYKINGRL